MQESVMQRMWDSAHLSGGNAAYVEELYELYLHDPNAVPEEWRTYFQKLPADIKKALTESADEAGNFMTNTIQQAEKETIEKMKKEGVTVIEVDKKAFREGRLLNFPS